MQLRQIENIHQFLRHTPEERVRRSLLDPRLFTAAEARLALKIARACDVPEFAVHFKLEDFPRIRMTVAETKIRDTFWPRLKAMLRARGLLDGEERPRGFEM